MGLQRAIDRMPALKSHHRRAGRDRRPSARHHRLAGLWLVGLIAALQPLGVGRADPGHEL